MTCYDVAHSTSGKELLFAYIRQAKKVDDLNLAIIETRSGATRTTRTLNGMMVDRSNLIDRRAEKLVILSERYDMELSQLFRIESGLLSAIGKIADNVHATFLIRKYILSESYDDIALALGYCTQQLRRINVKCLDKLSEIVI